MELMTFFLILALEVLFFMLGRYSMRWLYKENERLRNKLHALMMEVNDILEELSNNENTGKDCKEGGEK